MIDLPEPDRDAMIEGGATPDSGTVDLDRPMRGLGRQGLLNASATIITGIYTVVAVGTILHALGAAAYAAWAIAVVLLGWISLLDLGLSQTVVRASARAMLGDDAGVRDVRAASSVFAVLGVVAAVVGLALACLIPIVLGLSPPTSGEAIATGWVLALDAAVVLGTASWPGILRGTGHFGRLLATSLAQVATSLPLLILLLPALGLVGAACAQIAGRVVGRTLMAVLLSRSVPWFSPRPGRPTRPEIRRVGRFSAPIFLMQLSAQIGTGTDILIVGATAGATSAGLYAAGAQLVRYLAYFLFPVIDVVYPRLSSIEFLRPRLAEPVVIRSLFLAATLGTTAFGGLALEGIGALTLWSGGAAGLSLGVLVLYSITYAIIVPAHILVIALVARGRHRTVALAIFVEAIVNLLLSIILVQLMGPIGPAVSTLVVVSVNDLLLIPSIASRQLRVSLFRIVLAGAGGAAVAIAILAATRVIGGEGVVDMLARGCIALVLLSGVLAIGFRRPIRAIDDGADAATTPVDQASGSDA